MLWTASKKATEPFACQAISDSFSTLRNVTTLKYLSIFPKTVLKTSSSLITQYCK